MVWYGMLPKKALVPTEEGLITPAIILSFIPFKLVLFFPSDYAGCSTEGGKQDNF